jgi:Domain of unknown function (DUF5615)
MLLYADEDFPYPVVHALRQLGHDVVTAQEDGQASAPDTVVLGRAHSLMRSVLTHNRRHYERLHRQRAAHSGIISATRDANYQALAGRIDVALAGMSPGNWLVRVNRLP